MQVGGRRTKENGLNRFFPESEETAVFPKAGETDHKFAELSGVAPKIRGTVRRFRSPISGNGSVRTNTAQKSGGSFAVLPGFGAGLSAGLDDDERICLAATPQNNFHGIAC